MTKSKQDLKTLRCALCGVELEETYEGYEVVNPGARIAVVLHVCDMCWKNYQEVKKWDYLN